MKNAQPRVIPRRQALRALALTAGAAAALPLAGLLGGSRAVAAESSGKASKAEVKYQDHPDGAAFCANCANFTPGPAPDAPGACLVVAGEISPKGWCLAYAAG
ncbi:high-potential iron-sulfur protein [uncultured Castellaniella sp.]|uniref:high-potential iron-sulfur protein n=1 Tax=uncultured Castellaniella sp. TaxID=647907 RepID=UPI002624FECA|nr:high-potential iron-sulfur protein [uncultured Castellaniella sp.]